MGQELIIEGLKGIGVLLFLGSFVVLIKKAYAIAIGFQTVLTEKGFSLDQKYRQKVLLKVIKNQISFQPFNVAKLELYVVSELFNSKEFKANVLAGQEVEIINDIEIKN